MTEEKKIGYDGLTDTLKKENYEPVGIHNPQKFITMMTAPNIKRKRQGHATIVIPDEIFNNTEDTRQFNQGKYRMLILFVEAKA